MSVVGVVDFYKGLVGTWIIDREDAGLADNLRSRGVRVIVTTTIMAEPRERPSARRSSTLVSELRLVALATPRARAGGRRRGRHLAGRADAPR